MKGKTPMTFGEIPMMDEAMVALWTKLGPIDKLIASMSISAEEEHNKEADLKEDAYFHSRDKSRIDMISKSIKTKAFKKQKTTKVFQKGDEVEMASLVDGFIGSYYNATIVTSGTLPGRDNYRVKYKTLLTNDEASPLEDIVIVSMVWPVPPDHQTKIILVKNDFCLYDMVDVFTNDGWWFGLITGKIGKKCYFYFPTTRDNIEYPSDVWRFHQEWSNGEWI
ncbi:protein AGENET DOMAIN (AGD)-CONTAINING P1-like [Solanum dulcamara]|uniref:protein AGENET DOMAIN (AGD)-CONTAINING P1-like n=1 Tax=Solanum dulcamara TaxID=45834 RepID=UPI0024866139|nr:protein AGENET DOMAIN (AGD)-CONTAINING P1-like [Solanum dulcamara]